MVVMTIVEFVTCAALGVGSLAGGVAGQSEAVDTVNIEKYVGRWTQLYGNTVSERIATSGLTCVGANYSLDEPSGNITVLNFGRVGSPTGSLQTITGYAYTPDENEPGQLKVSFPFVPVDGDYWIVGLGPATFGPDGLYEWAVVSDAAAEQLYILVRDVEEFEDCYEASVLTFVREDLGFTGREKKPRRIVQEGCLTIDLTDAAEETADEDSEVEDSGDDSGDQDDGGLIEAVDELEISKYIGSWRQLYGNTFSAEVATSGLVCVGAVYGFDEPSGNITVFNFGREGTPTGEPSTITGYVYGTDENEPGQLKVSLAFVPSDSDYWVVGLGPATFGPEGLYEWAIVSEPTAEQLYILVRDVEDFEASHEASVLAYVTDGLGFTGRERKPRRMLQEGCPPVDLSGSAEGGGSPEGGFSGEGDSRQDSGEDSEEVSDGEDSSGGSEDQDEEDGALIETVDELDVAAYLGKWTQLYGNKFSEESATSGLVCVGAFYGLDEPSGNITVFNFGREGIPTGELRTITGYAYGNDENEPGQLKVSFASVPADGDYWIVGLGPATFGPDGLYEWAIVSGPTAEQLFILVRDVEDFEVRFESSVLALVREDLGFKGRGKKPRRTVQKGCMPVDVLSGGLV